MRLKLWTAIEAGTVTANLEINNYSASEKVQSTKFGPIVVNLGGAFAAEEHDTTPAINFSLEPISLIIDPVNSSEVTFKRVFKVSAEIANPSLAAKTFCDINLAKVTDVVSQWKLLTDAYVTNYDTTL